MLTSKDEDEIFPFSEFMMLREVDVDGQLSWRTGDSGKHRRDVDKDQEVQGAHETAIVLRKRGSLIKQVCRCPYKE